MSPAGRKGPGTPTNARPFPLMRKKDLASWQPLEPRPAHAKLPTQLGTIGLHDSTSQGRARPGRRPAPAVSGLLTPRGGLFTQGLGWRRNILQPNSSTAMQGCCWRVHTAGECVGGFAHICSGPGNRLPGGWGGTRCVCVYLEALVWGVGRLGTSSGAMVNSVNIYRAALL